VSVWLLLTGISRLVVCSSPIEHHPALAHCLLHPLDVKTLRYRQHFTKPLLLQDTCQHTPLLCPALLIHVRNLLLGKSGCCKSHAS
jgi:hypothetical protein